MIILKNLTKSTNEKELFRDLSLTLNPGDRIGVIGPNGCGKSTLLRIIAGIENSDTGTINRAQEQILLAPQQIDVSPSTTINDYLDPAENPDVWRLLSELDLIEIPLDTPIHQLSGGQKTKLLLTKIFSSPSSTLLLDEPTNHLDTVTRQWLTENILTYSGIILVISHDRTFLNVCATEILEIDPANHHTSLYQGNYDAFKQEKALEFDRRTDDYYLQQRKKKDMLQWMALKRQEATAHPSPAKGRQLKQMEHRLEREILNQEIAKPQLGKDMVSANFAGAVHTGKLILRLSDVSKHFDDHPVLQNVTFELRGKTHFRLVGENGSGKSTLLRIITGELSPDHGTVEIGENVRIGYFAQQLETLNPYSTVMESFVSKVQRPFTESRARATLGAFLFTGDIISKKIRNISYGERVRLQLAILLQQESQLLILDEPTNHLDIPSREIIENALREYQGALLIVSHDEYFLKSIGIDTELVLNNGTI